MTNKKPDDSGVAGSHGGPGPASPGARPRPDDESTAMNELAELARRPDLDVTAPLPQLKESDLEDARPGAPAGPDTDVGRAPARLGWAAPAKGEKGPPASVGLPADAAPEQDVTQEVRLDAPARAHPPDTSVSPPPTKRPSQPSDTTVSPPPQARRESRVEVPAAHEQKGADTTVSPAPARAERPSDTTVSPPPARRASQVAVPAAAVAEPRPPDTTVSPPPPSRRASQLGVPAAHAPEKPASDTTVSPPPARRAGPAAVPATDPSVEPPTPQTATGAEATSEIHLQPPAVALRRPSQVAVAAAHADLGNAETREVHLEARPAAKPLGDQETKEVPLGRPAPESIENLKTRDVHVEPRRPSKAEVPATNPVAAQEETREIAAPRPGAQVVPWKPSFPAPNAQTPASVIVHASATELQKVEPPPKPAAPQVVLEVVGGHDIGRKVAMKGNRLTVGREPCDLNLADAAVALVHLELIDGPDGLMLYDRSGGAGTRVNGKEVSKTVLRPGDRIGLGRTILVVRRGLERKSPARKALEATRPVFNALRPRNLPAVTQSFLNQFPAGRWRKVAVGSIGLAVVVALIAVFVPRRGAPEDAGRPAAPRVGDAALALADAEKLFDARQYDAALRKGHDAQRLADGPEVRRFLARCGEAIQVKRQIDSAAAAAARGQYDLALAKGRAIRASGTLGARLEGLMKTWSAARDDAIVQNVRMEAQDGDFATARALIVRSPATLQGTLLREVDDLESKAAGEKPRP